MTLLLIAVVVAGLATYATDLLAKVSVALWPWPRHAPFWFSAAGVVTMLVAILGAFLVIVLIIALCVNRTADRQEIAAIEAYRAELAASPCVGPKDRAYIRGVNDWIALNQRLNQSWLFDSYTADEIMEVEPLELP